MSNRVGSTPDRALEQRKILKMAVTVDRARVRPPEKRDAGSKEQPNRRRSRELLASWWWALPAILIAVFVHYLMVGVGGTFAFTDWRGIGEWHWVGIENFAQAFKPGGLG